ncbi:uncharacterized protein LOC130789037 [Actinidia eriantha]|uniref:uncharacterized protein LOC130789037 n=1 Tax=Actinidia eriantha TaxID=165200 RepID=UPI00258C6186|nr:uncharacterized protein LOC130789037 [Actinidia eriantha]
MVTKMFKPVLGRTMDAYIDDMVVKSRKESDHLRDLFEIFAILQQHKLRLNAAKCTFGVGSGKFLGHLITRRGIEADPEQIAAINQLTSPRNAKEVQKLTGMAAALNRFISKSSNKCRPFFKLLRKNTKFVWDEESELALQQFKKYLTEPPLLSTPDEGELLHVYLAVSEHAVSSVLLREVAKEQRPIYFVSKMMTDCQTRYLQLEKLVLALIVTSRKLMHYFQAHPISVYTEYPLKDILLKADLTGRLSKWSLELGQFDIKFSSRMAIKGQVLADFVAEFSPKSESPEHIQLRPPQSKDDDLRGISPELQELNGNTEVDSGPPGGDGASNSRKAMEGIMELPQTDSALAWEVHVDGAQNSQGTGAGVVLKSPEGATFEQCLRFDFPAINNEAEYEALIAGLRSASKLGVRDLCIYSDSKLVVNQVMGKFEARGIKMAKYLRMAKGLINEFRTFKIEQVGRELNAHADSLAALVAVFEGKIGRTIAVDIIPIPSIEDMQESVMVNTELGPSWMDPIVKYLRTDELPDDKKEAHRIRIKAARFWISPSGDLYKRSYQGPYLLCVHPSLIEDVLDEIHEGICGLHSGGRSLAHRALSQGYWWPYMQKDA